MPAADTELAGSPGSNETNFGLFLCEMRQQRRGNAHRLLKTLRPYGVVAHLLGLELFPQCELLTLVRRDILVQKDRHLLVILGRKLADDQMPCTGRRLPVDAAKIVVRLIVAKCEQILTRTAFCGDDLPRLERSVVMVEFKVGEFWKDDQLRLACREPASMPEHAERKLRRQLEILYYESPAVREDVFRL